MTCAKFENSLTATFCPPEAQEEDVGNDDEPPPRLCAAQVVSLCWVAFKELHSTYRIFGYMVNYMGGCQNYGPLLGPQYNTAPSI